MIVDSATADDLEAIAKMMIALWLECNFHDELENNKRLLNSARDILLVAKEDNICAGFIHVSLRYEHVEGTDSSPAGYIEAIYVARAFRKQSAGRQLVAAGAEWAVSKGCTEYASDAELHNEESIEFHQKMGFTEQNRVVCFAKQLD